MTKYWLLMYLYLIILSINTCFQVVEYIVLVCIEFLL